MFNKDELKYETQKLFLRILDAMDESSISDESLFVRDKMVKYWDKTVKCLNKFDKIINEPS